MTTAIAPAAADTARQERFEHLSIAALVESGHNPRSAFDAAKLEELAASIREQGVITPLVVRDLPGHTFEIIDGARRLRAAKLAGVTAVPARILTLTDEEALELRLVVNLQRSDLTPLDQARGYRALIVANPQKYSASTIASRIGMSEAWVWDRLKLLDLVPEAQALLEQERMSVGHAIPIARLKPEQQLRVIDLAKGGLFGQDRAQLEWDEHAKGKPGKYDGVKPNSIRELETWIADHIRFDVAHAGKAAPLDFGDVAARVEHAAAKPGRGKKVIAITYDSYLQPEARDERERTFGPHSWKRADGQQNSKTCEHSVLGVVSAGTEQYGRAFEVCIARDKCDVHWKREKQEREKNQKLRDAGKGKQADRREAAGKKRAERERLEREQRETRWKVFKPALTKAVLAAVAKMPAALPKHVFQKLMKHEQLPPATTPAQLQKALLEAAMKSVFDSYAWYSQEPEMVAWASALGVDVKACEPKVEEKTTPAAAAKKNGKKGRAA